MPFGAWANYVFDKNVLGELVEITFHPDSMSFTAYYDGQTWRMDKWEHSEWWNPVHRHIRKKQAIFEYETSDKTDLKDAIEEIVNSEWGTWKHYFTMGRKITFNLHEKGAAQRPVLILEFNDNYFPVFTEEEIQQIRDILGDRLAHDWNGAGCATVSFSLKNRG